MRSPGRAATGSWRGFRKKGDGVDLDLPMKLAVETMTDDATVRSREEIARQAEPPVPPNRKSLRCNVGQTVSSVNSASQAIISRLLTGRNHPAVQLISRHPWQRQVWRTQAASWARVARDGGWAS